MPCRLHRYRRACAWCLWPHRRHRHRARPQVGFGSWPACGVEGVEWGHGWGHGVVDPLGSGPELGHMTCCAMHLLLSSTLFPRSLHAGAPAPCEAGASSAPQSGMCTCPPLRLLLSPRRKFSVSFGVNTSSLDGSELGMLEGWGLGAGREREAGAGRGPPRTGAAMA